MNDHIRDHGADTTACCTGRHRRLVQQHSRAAAPRAATPRPAAGAPTGRGFWSSLTPAEQAAFLAAAHPIDFSHGEVLWHEGELADHVVVIRSGRVRVSVRRDGRERLLAFRGPGDIIGERASLRLRRRSATIVAVEDIDVLVMTTQEFAAYLTRHPQVLAVLEEELYERLAEPSPEVHDTPPPEPAARPAAACSGPMCLHGPPIPAPAPPPAVQQQPTCCASTHGTHQAVVQLHGASPHPAPGTATPPPSWAGRNCTIMCTDIAGYSGTHRDDADRLDMKQGMYELLQEAFAVSTVPWDACHREDRGDGVLIVVPAEVPTASLVDPLITWLAARLRRHNRRSSEIAGFQLRIALHVGPVTPDGHGVSGWPLIQASRLLDAAPLKDRLAATGADLGVVASPFVYESVIAHSPGYVDAAAYEPLTCKVKGTEVSGWMHLLGGPLRAVT